MHTCQCISLTWPMISPGDFTLEYLSTIISKIWIIFESELRWSDKLFSSLNFDEVTNGQTESNPYEPMVHMHRSELRAQSILWVEESGVKWLFKREYCMDIMEHFNTIVFNYTWYRECQRPSKKYSRSLFYRTISEI